MKADNRCPDESQRRTERDPAVSPPPRQVEEITFKNFYTAYLSVRLLRRSPGQDAAAKWSTALRDLPLMDNPHTEGGSQDYYSIHRTQVGVASISRGAGAVLT